MTNVLMAVVAATAVSLLLHWLLGRHKIRERVRQLEQLLEQMKQDHARELQAVRDEYEEKIAHLRSMVDYLLATLSASPPPTVEPEPVGRLHKPVLLVCGSSRFCRQDRQSLRRAGARAHILHNATKQRVEEEIERRRMDGRLYKWLHISADASPEGVDLQGELAEPGWWHELLYPTDEVEGIFLAACETSATANVLAGLVPYVVTVDKRVSDDDAAMFSLSFWRTYVRTEQPELAYRQALVEVPQVAEFVDLRHYRR